MLCKFTIHLLILSLLATSALAESTSAPSHKPLKPRVEANWRHSNDRSILMTEFWVPVAQNEIDGSVVYGDLRLMGDNTSNREFNIGAGYRKMVETTLLGEGIAGANIWYDRRFTKRGSKFNQVTAGMEWFGDVWDAKLNAYLPLNDSKNHTQGNPNGSSVHFAGNQIIVNTDQSVVEEALPGIDFELGWKVPFVDDFTDSTRIYAGAYHFQGDRADNVTGWRARIASDVSSDVQIGARFQRDAERGSQTFVEATIRFPFGNKQSYKKKGLRARLDESPERDIDIVSNEAVIDQGLNKVLLNATTGTVQNVIHVDNTAAGGGDGSIDTPFNTLAAAEGAATTNDLIYVHRGDGTTAGQNIGITLDDEGQMLIGSGSSLIFVDGRFSTSNGLSTASNILIPADPLGAPVITNGAGNGIDVTANNVFLSGVAVDGSSSHNVAVINANDFEINGVTLTNATVNGLDVTLNDSNTYNIQIKNNISNNNNLKGMHMGIHNNTVLDVNLIGNVTSFNFDDGIFLISADNAKVTAQISNNTANNNSNSGQSVGIQTISGGSSNIVSTVANNITNNNATLGIYQYSNGTSMTTTTIKNNISNSNGGHGIFVLGNLGTAQTNADVIGNSTDDNGFNISLFSRSDTTVDVNLVGNTMTNARNTSLLVSTIDNSNLSASISNNIITGAVNNSVYINNDSTVTANTDLGGGSLGSIGNNSFYNSGGTEVRIDLDGAELKAENNWWGTVSGLVGGEITLETGSTIDSTPFLNIDPNL